MLGCRIEMQGVASPGKCSARSLAINVVLLHSIMMLHFNAHTGHTHTQTRVTRTKKKDNLKRYLQAGATQTRYIYYGRRD